MNIKQQNILRSLLKKYGYKSVSNMVRQGMGINFENFLLKTEPLYAVPRIASCYADDGKRETLTGGLYKEWLKDVVEKRWVEPVNRLADEHGADTVLAAIYYLLDNGLWETYEGRFLLDATDKDYYSKLGDMPAAIAKVKELASSTEKKEEAEGRKLDENWPFRPKYILNGDEAVLVSAETDELMLHLVDNVSKLTDYISTAVDSDVLRGKIDKQQKEIVQLQGQIAEQQKRADEANATMQKASDFISRLRAEVEESQRNYDILNEKYNKALDERDDADKELAACRKLLDEAAQKEQMPRKKIIPQSEIMDVPLLGMGVLKGLVPVLNRHGVTVDPNR